MFTDSREPEATPAPTGAELAVTWSARAAALGAVVGAGYLAMSRVHTSLPNQWLVKTGVGVPSALVG